MQEVLFTGGDNDLILVTSNSAAIRFPESEVRPMGLMAAGVNGIKLHGEDKVVLSGVIREGSEVILLDSTGKAWRLSAEEYPCQGRYGRGVSAAKVTGDAKILGGFTDNQNRTILAILRKSALKTFRMDEIELGKRTRIGQDVSNNKTR